MLGTPRMLLKEPYTRKVRGKIRELRIRDSEGAVRIFYFTFTGKRIVLSHGFIKKTARTPLRELEIAEKRMNDFIDRVCLYMKRLKKDPSVFVFFADGFPCVSS